MKLHEAEIERQKHSSDKDRLKALSDGVFAIAMTLLVLELHNPPAVSGETEQMFINMMWERLPNFISFLMSFAIIGLYWIAHTLYFRIIKEVDRKIMRLNLIFLFMVSFFPFPTAVVGSHGYLISAWVFYSVNLILMGLSLMLVMSHAEKNNLLAEHITPELKKYLFRRSLAVPGVFFISILVAFVSLGWAHWLPLSIPLILRGISLKGQPQEQ